MPFLRTFLTRTNDAGRDRGDNISVEQLTLRLGTESTTTRSSGDTLELLHERLVSYRRFLLRDGTTHAAGFAKYFAEYYRRLATARCGAEALDFIKGSYLHGGFRSRSYLSALAQALCAAIAEARSLSAHLRRPSTKPDRAYFDNIFKPYAAALASLGRHEDALTCYREALASSLKHRRRIDLQSDGQIAFLLHCIGYNLARLNRFEESIDPVTRAAAYYRALEHVDSEQFSPSLAMTYGHLGACHYTLDNDEEAQVYLRKAIALYQSFMGRLKFDPYERREKVFTEYTENLTCLSKSLSRTRHFSAAYDVTSELIDAYKTNTEFSQSKLRLPEVYGMRRLSAEQLRISCELVILYEGNIKLQIDKDLLELIDDVPLFFESLECMYKAAEDLCGIKAGLRDILSLQDSENPLLNHYLMGASHWTSQRFGPYIEILPASWQCFVPALNRRPFSTMLLHEVGHLTLSWDSDWGRDYLLWPGAREAFATPLGVYACWRYGSTPTHMSDRNDCATIADFAQQQINMGLEAFAAGARGQDGVFEKGDAPSARILEAVLFDLLFNHFNGYDALREVLHEYVGTRRTLRQAALSDTRKMEEFFIAWGRKAGLNIASYLSEWGFEAARIAQQLEDLPNLAADLPQHRKPVYGPAIDDTFVRTSKPENVVSIENVTAATITEARMLHRPVEMRPFTTTDPLLLQALQALRRQITHVDGYYAVLGFIAEAKTLDAQRTHAQSECFRHDLATIWQDVSCHLNLNGQPESSRLALMQAVNIYRSLVAAYPGRYEVDLAYVLGVLVDRTAQSPAERLPVMQELVAAWRAANTGSNDAYGHHLAKRLRSLSDLSAEFGRGDEALAALAESVVLYRSLTQREPLIYQEQLLDSLKILRNSLNDIERYDQALEVTSELVELCRTLAVAKPNECRVPYLISRSCLRWQLTQVGRHEESLEKAFELAADYRESIEREGLELDEKLVLELHSISCTLQDHLDRETEAVGILEDAIAIFRTSKTGTIDQSVFSNLYRSLAVLFVKLRREPEASQVIEEGITFFRTRYQSDPHTHAKPFAYMLHHGAYVYDSFKRDSKTVAVLREIIFVYQEIADLEPETRHEKMAIYLWQCGERLAALERYEEAYPVFVDSILLHRALPRENLQRPSASLAEQLRSIAAELIKLSRSEEAERYISEAALLETTTLIG